jgi:hypothetical protein
VGAWDPNFLCMKETKIDLLRRVFVPVEKRTAAGTLVFRTLDNQVYVRLEDGSIRRSDRKVRGKTARRADKCARKLCLQRGIKP